MEILVKMKGLKLNPISVMYYVSPCSTFCLLFLWIFLEKPRMDAQGAWNFKPLVLTRNSVCTFALNVYDFLVISHTSALTIRVAGVVKDWVVFLLSTILFADSKLTLMNLLCYAIAIAGLAAYNNHKLKKEAFRVVSEKDCPWRQELGTGFSFALCYAAALHFLRICIHVLVITSKQEVGTYLGFRVFRVTSMKFLSCNEASRFLTSQEVRLHIFMTLLKIVE